MFVDAQRRITLKRAQLALDRGNLDAACRYLSSASLTDIQRGQELAYKLADALLARAGEHAAARNEPEALLDLKRALALGGAKPEAVKLRNEILERLGQGSRDAPAPGKTQSRRYLLWIDAVGTYLLLPHARVTLGQCDADPEPDIPLTGTTRRLAAEIVRIGDHYRICSHGEVSVNNVQVSDAQLASGDRIRIERSPELRFFLPPSACSTALLKLQQPSVLPGQSREVILFDRFLLVGRNGLPHIPTPTGPKGLVLLMRDGEFRVLQPALAASERGREYRVTLGARIGFDGLRFTITEG